ncbi:MAG TPA: hypothetical protein VJJ80_03470 [Patescibacteria group bacterium]|nr:hypothetical protein [Patescibacteria group bacterium]
MGVGDSNQVLWDDVLNDHFGRYFWLISVGWVLKAAFATYYMQANRVGRIAYEMNKTIHLYQSPFDLWIRQSRLIEIEFGGGHECRNRTVSPDPDVAVCCLTPPTKWCLERLAFSARAVTSSGVRTDVLIIPISKFLSMSKKWPRVPR